MPIKILAVSLLLSSCTTIKTRTSVQTISKCWVTCKDAKTLHYIEQTIDVNGLGYSLDQDAIRCVCKDRTVIDLMPNSGDKASSNIGK